MKKKRKLKKSVKIFLVVFVVLIIGIIMAVNAITKRIRYIHSYDYKLLKVGYSEEEITEIKKLDEDKIEVLLNKKYNKLIVKFMKQKYFIFDKLDDYIKYYKDSENDDLDYTITMVNVKADHDYYDEDVVTSTNINDGKLMLVNKYHNLSKDYVPENLVDVSNKYGYGENKLEKEAYDNFLNMWNAAKEKELSLIITSAYRDYDYQDKLWKDYAHSKGNEWADSVAARPGFSEHQTGLTIDIVTYGSKMNDFENTDEFKWLNENAYKYGFILRYPKDKEKITGYSYESWHYRYVGKEVAEKIKNEGITYDEYYAYYIEPKQTNKAS